MFKVIGGMLIIFACAAFGVEKSRELSIHRRELEELQRIFMNIQTELEYIKTPIGELFMKLQKKVEGSCRVWLDFLVQNLTLCKWTSFEEVWTTSIDTYFKQSLLTKSELEELKQIGKHISRPEAIRLYLIQLENAIQTTREEEKEKKKLYQSMGILTGIFLVLVLI